MLYFDDHMSFGYYYSSRTHASEVLLGLIYNLNVLLCLNYFVIIVL